MLSFDVEMTGIIKILLISEINNWAFVEISKCFICKNFSSCFKGEISLTGTHGKRDEMIVLCVCKDIQLTKYYLTLCMFMIFTNFSSLSYIILEST